MVAFVVVVVVALVRGPRAQRAGGLDLDPFRSPARARGELDLDLLCSRFVVEVGVAGVRECGPVVPPFQATPRWGDSSVGIWNAQPKT